jgi:hypothetical protein
MRRMEAWWLACSLLMAGAPVLGVASASGSSHVSATTAPSKRPRQDFDRLHGSYLPRAAFTENLGQWPESALFCGGAGSDRLWLTRTGWTVDLGAAARSPSPTIDGRVAVRFELCGADPTAAVNGLDRQAARLNVFRGNDAMQWIHGAASYAQVEYEHPWPGVRLTVQIVAGLPKYSLFLAAGISPDVAVLRCEGADTIEQSASDLLTIRAGGQTITQPLGHCFQPKPDGSHVTRRGSFRLLGEGRFGFEIEALDPSLPLVIDPDLLWSTYLGSATGDVGDRPTTVRRAPNGDLFVVGKAESINFPTTPGAYVHHGGIGIGEPFVTRFSYLDGALLWSSIVGGPSGQERATGLAVDSQGRPVVYGWTDGPGFPTTLGAFDTTFAGQDAFVFRLSAAGDALEFSTFLGPAGTVPFGITVDSQDRPIVVGMSLEGFPTTPGVIEPNWLPVPGLFFRGFVTKLNTDGGSLAWSTYFGGAGGGVVFCVALDAQENVILAGAPDFPSFPTTPGAFQPTFPGSSGNGNGYVSKLDPNATSLIWSTFLGGTQRDWIYAMQLDRHANVALVGSTRSYDFPVTPDVYQPQYSGDPTNYQIGDTFVTYLSSDGGSAIYSTYVGGPSPDIAFDVDVDRSGVVTITGMTFGQYPATPGAFDTTYGGSLSDAYVARLDPRGRKLLYSTMIGGPSANEADGLVVGEQGTVTIMGATGSNYPVTAGAFDPTYNGGQSDCFVTQMDLLPAGITKYGEASPPCAGDPYMGAIGDVSVSRPSHVLYASQGPSLAQGLVLVSNAASSQGFDLNGCRVWVARAGVFVRKPVSTDLGGYGEARWHFPPSATPGTTFYAQFVFRSTDLCAGVAPRIGTNALSITLQP